MFERDVPTEHSQDAPDRPNGPFARAGDPRADREQKAFLAEVVLRNLPEWLARDIRVNKLEILDWGCAEGDSTETLARALDTSVVGVDVAERAVESARARFPARRFLHGLTDPIEAHDVLFTSNALEPADDPPEILRTHLAHARKYAIILAPFRNGRRDEGPRALGFDGVPCRMGRFRLLSFTVIGAPDLPDPRWPGPRILLVYGEKRFAPSDHPRLSTLVSAPIDRMEEPRRAAERRAAGLVAELVALRDEIQRARTTRVLKLVTVLGAALRHPFGTFAMILRWLRGSYRPLGFGLTGALCAHDPLWRLEERARQALDRFGKVASTPGVPAGPAHRAGAPGIARPGPGARVRIWRATLSAALRLRKALAHQRAPLVALQVDAFDKGGLEEVVLTLARHLGRDGSVHVVVLVAGDTVGYLGEVAAAQGIPVLPLARDRLLLRLVLRLLPIRLANLHYSIFGVTTYARARTPVVYSIHNTYVWADPGFVRERAKAYRHAAAFVAVSEPVRGYFASKFGVDPGLVETIPNGLDLEYVARPEQVSRASLGLVEDDVVFVNVASFTWSKLHILMVAAMERLVRRFPLAKLLFVGNALEPACLSDVNEAIRSRGLETSILILDYLPKSRLLGLLEASDCFVLPSLFEGWSIAVMEAMHSGLPLILSDVGSARAVIENGDIGAIIPNPFGDLRDLTPDVVASLAREGSDLANLGELVRAMESICRDRNGWKLRARAGREKIAGAYTATHMCQRYLSCYRRLISEKGGNT